MTAPTAGSGGGAGTGPGGGAGTGPTPSGPPSPTPTKSDDVFSLAAALGADVATVYSGRDGKGAVERASRPDFQLPVAPRFSMAEGGRRLVGRVEMGDGPARPGHPGPPPPPPPTPFPPPR